MLLERFRATRSERSFRELYRRHTPALYRVAMRIVRSDGARAEEVVQEAWARALHSLDRFQWRSTLRTWLTGIALNCARELLREEERSAASAFDETVAVRPIQEPIDTADLEHAIAGLPFGFRQALVLHDIEGYTHDEIALMLGVAAGTSKSQLSRARSALRAALTSQPPARTAARSEENRT